MAVHLKVGPLIRRGYRRLFRNSPMFRYHRLIQTRAMMMIFRDRV